MRAATIGGRGPFGSLGPGRSLRRRFCLCFFPTICSLHCRGPFIGILHIWQGMGSSPKKRGYGAVGIRHPSASGGGGGGSRPAQLPRLEAGARPPEAGAAGPDSYHSMVGSWVFSPFPSCGSAAGVGSRPARCCFSPLEVHLSSSLCTRLLA